MGVSLSQHQGILPKLFPFASYSKKISPVENYDVRNWKHLAIKLALEEWWYWLEGAHHPFVVYTDHHNLEYIRRAQCLSPCPTRWTLFSTQFQFTISFRPRSKNGKGNILSRIHDPEPSATKEQPIIEPSCLVIPILWEIGQEMSRAEADDPTPYDKSQGVVSVPVGI